MSGDFYRTCHWLCDRLRIASSPAWKFRITAEGFFRPRITYCSGLMESEMLLIIILIILIFGTGYGGYRVGPGWGYYGGGGLSLILTIVLILLLLKII